MVQINDDLPICPPSSVFSPQIARYYDPGLGRFLQADDLLFPDSAQGMNRLMYVEGNPIKFNDPTGHCAANTMNAIFGFGTLISMAVGVFGNYTGNGACTKRFPQEFQALYFLINPDQSFNNFDIDLEQFTILKLVYDYYRTKEGTGLTLVPERDMNIFLISQIITGQRSVENAVIIHNYLYYQVKTPQDNLDTASFAHDQYGSSPLRERSYYSNKQHALASRDIWLNPHKEFQNNFKQEFKRARGSNKDLKAGGMALFRTAVNHNIAFIAMTGFTAINAYHRLKKWSPSKGFKL